MPNRFFPLMLFALLCALAQLSCRAMLITPSSDQESADVMREAIIRRNSSEMSPDKVLRARDQEFAKQIDALKNLKVAEPLDAAQPAAAPAQTNYTNVAAVLLMFVFPIFAMLLVRWMTRRAMQLREREQLAMSMRK